MYQNFPDVEETTLDDNGGQEKGPEEEDNESVEDEPAGVYNLPPVPVPAPITYALGPTEKTQLLSAPAHQSQSGSNSLERPSKEVASTSTERKSKEGLGPSGGGTSRADFSQELALLATVDLVFVREFIEVADSLLGLGLNGQKKFFKVTDSYGHRLIAAQLDNPCCSGPASVVIKDRHDKTVIRMTLPRSSSCLLCFPCQFRCMGSFTLVTSEAGKTIGRFEQCNNNNLYNNA